MHWSQSRRSGPCADTYESYSVCSLIEADGGPRCCAGRNTGHAATGSGPRLAAGELQTYGGACSALCVDTPDDIAQLMTGGCAVHEPTSRNWLVADMRLSNNTFPNGTPQYFYNPSSLNK